MPNSLLVPTSVHSFGAPTSPVSGKTCRFLSLPNELIVEVLKYLPVLHILQIERVSVVYPSLPLRGVTPRHTDLQGPLSSLPKPQPLV